MTAEAIITVSAAVVALVQLGKWAIIPDRYGPVAVLLLALFGVLFSVWSSGSFVRTEAFAYFAAWISVATSAAGIYGFSRASGEALTRISAPPSTGAGSEPSVKS